MVTTWNGWRAPPTHTHTRPGFPTIVINDMFTKFVYINVFPHVLMTATWYCFINCSFVPFHDSNNQLDHNKV